MRALSESATIESTPILVAHYSEVWLKGCNRPFFVRELRKHIKRMVEDLPARLPPHSDRRLVIEAESDEAAERVVERLMLVPGVAYVGVGRRTSPKLEDIRNAAARLTAQEDLSGFRVRARRSAKNLPYTSGDLERAAGARILERAKATGIAAKVDLRHAVTTCHIEASPDAAYVYCRRIPGMGGLPTNTSGRLLCLLSGGIDSAVAAYRILKRGVRVPFVHFHGAPARAGEESEPIAREIAKKLTPYQGLSRLYLVPFDPIQREIVAAAPDEFRLLLYRRLMLRIAERVARGARCHGLVTGDSIAQVASQTIQNMEAVEAPATMPVFRPLCGDDKEDIVQTAKRIGTYEISIEPFTDCCPAYLPRNPRVFSTVQELDAAEAALDVDRLCDWAVANLRRETYEYVRGRVRLKSAKDYVGSEPPALDESLDHALAH